MSDPIPLVKATSYVTDPIYGGRWTITGWTVDGVLGARMVRLVHRDTGLLVQQTWSDASTGLYAFNYLAGPPNQYIAYAIDNENSYNCAIDDRVPLTRI